VEPEKTADRFKRRKKVKGRKMVETVKGAPRLQDEVEFFGAGKRCDPAWSSSIVGTLAPGKG